MPVVPDAALILYTTGFTGTHKGVMPSHANLLFGGQTSAGMRAMTPDDVIPGVPDFSEGPAPM